MYEPDHGTDEPPTERSKNLSPKLNPSARNRKSNASKKQTKKVIQQTNPETKKNKANNTLSNRIPAGKARSHAIIRIVGGLSDTSSRRDFAQARCIEKRRKARYINNKWHFDLRWEWGFYASRSRARWISEWFGPDLWDSWYIYI